MPSVGMVMLVVPGTVVFRPREDGRSPGQAGYHAISWNHRMLQYDSNRKVGMVCAELDGGTTTDGPSHDDGSLDTKSCHKVKNNFCTRFTEGVTTPSRLPIPRHTQTIYRVTRFSEELHHTDPRKIIRVFPIPMHRYNRLPFFCAEVLCSGP